MKTNRTKPVKEIMNEVICSIEKFRGKREQNDDITIVLVKNAVDKSKTYYFIKTLS